MGVDIIIGDLRDERVEIVERKGIGHPDTMCDEISESVSRELCKYYLEKFGVVLHHNVDKALLVAGQSRPRFRGGEVLKPFNLILAGRATGQAKGQNVPIEEIAQETATLWINEHLRHVDVSQHVKFSCRIRSGSAELVELFERFGTGEVPLANDTSYGAGSYPSTPLGQNLIEIERLLLEPSTRKRFPYVGEDIKVMGVRNEERVDHTVAIAMVDKYIVSVEDYASKIGELRDFLAGHMDLPVEQMHLNTADDYERGSIYLTVTGTSAENGDDGQVGRGNRINGLITPYLPMSLEATSGKNPVSHVGKIYNHFSLALSREIVERNMADRASTFIVSQIGKPIDQPQLLHVKLKGMRVENSELEKLCRQMLGELCYFWKKMLDDDHGL